MVASAPSRLGFIWRFQLRVWILYCFCDFDHVPKYLLGISDVGRLWHYQSVFALLALLWSCYLVAWCHRWFVVSKLQSDSGSTEN